MWHSSLPLARISAVGFGSRQSFERIVDVVRKLL